jgi:hypothetical protein
MPYMVRHTYAQAASAPSVRHGQVRERGSLPNQALQRTISSLAPLGRLLAAERQDVGQTSHEAN